MRTGLIGACVLAVAGCNTPPLGYAGIAPVQVTVGQSTFDVRIKEGQAQAMRTNREFAPNFTYVAPRARTAIMQASGCQIKEGSLVGDAILITADLLCDATATETEE